MQVTPVVRTLARSLETPFLLMDLSYVRNNYYDIINHVNNVRVFYAVKANSHPRIVSLLNTLGSSFDVASRGEIDKLLSLNITPDRMSFGNTIKKIEDIKYAHSVGVEYFAADSEMEIEKIAAHAPGSKVYVRIMTTGSDSDWPLSKKFGTDVEHVISILRYADNLGLDAYGVSFHVGSQNYNVANWEKAIIEAAKVFKVLRTEGINLRMINLGGGMPVKHIKEIPSVKEIGDVINRAIERELSFVPNLEVFIEPGRSMVGNAGILVSQVILRSRKGNEDWVYADAGVFHGLTETIENFRYEIIVDGKQDDKKEIFTLAGPSCDSIDTIYEKVELPKTIGYGDILYFINAGAYTTEYATNFNGIKAPGVYFVEDFTLAESEFFQDEKGFEQDL
ncbi:type III PLP-dependent enzyme [Kosmotoga pacifica]|uniref:ornithine decarboxylase n=1 Tax=Kosmotoga pacifica TaxID=1330330 RepID=A0A0G2ZA75_9BACT|nr:type III PLP-dependent enzyme [Kosmotoga pacifica]AKI96986.1 ornithine decarboxylase [Kosmotoga pacifica]